MNVQHWGLLDFNTAWDKQRELARAVEQGEPDTLVLCEHPDVITLGRATKNGAVIASIAELTASGVSVVDIDRGGEATVHNPGQLVGYPIMNLQRTKPDLHWFLRTVEQCIIDALREFGVEGGRVDGRTGVWIENDRKICAIGFHCRSWITTHGFALNVSNNLDLFAAIIPCGITDKGVTSLQNECPTPPSMVDVEDKITMAFRRYFE